jgi:hypothetical protein
LMFLDNPLIEVIEMNILSAIWRVGIVTSDEMFLVPVDRI